MHVLILGSGVIGTTTAYYLTKSGHQVTVVDRQSGPALETSYANAGEVSPGYSAPWAGPGIPIKAIKWMLMKHRPLVIKSMLDIEMWRWSMAMLRNCTEARYQINKSRMVRLAEYSRNCLMELRSDTGIEYDQRTQGTLQLFRTQKQLDGAGKDIEVLKQYEVPFQLLEGDSCIEYEPALALVKEKFVGALRLPKDETGDCYKFTEAVASLSQSQGAEFKFDTNIIGFEKTGDKITGVKTDRDTLQADHYVLATGSYSPLLTKPIGIRLPIYPVKGFSITVPIEETAMAPQSTVMDETHKVAVTRLGDRIRVGGTAQLSGYDLSLDRTRQTTLEFVVNDLFPKGGDTNKASFWTGLRPMTPDGTPIIGATRYDNLFLNTGHGTLGWTMAAGSGRLMADLISNRTPEIDLEGLQVNRYY